MGQYGILPEIKESEPDPDAAVSLIESKLKRRSLIPSPTPRRSAVKIDLETLEPEAISPPFSSGTMKSSSSSRLDSSHESVGRKRSGRESLGLELHEQETLGQHMSSQTSVGQMRMGNESIGRKTSGEEPRTLSRSTFSNSSLAQPRIPSRQSAIPEEDDTDSVFSFYVPDDQMVSKDGMYGFQKKI